MQRLIITLAFTIAMVCASCMDSTTPSSVSSRFSYSGRDSIGLVCVIGWITIEHSSATSYNGKWELDTLPGVAHGDVGPQVGAGNWAGALTGNILHAGLNPLNADYNVDLSGVYADSIYSGTWTYSTLHGVTNHGTFEARRQ